MTTYRELIYMCLDVLKGTSDDFSYTEEHIAYLLDKFRALLLKQRYGADPKKHVPYSNYQNIIITFNNIKDSDKPKLILKSDKNVPYTLQLGIPRITSNSDNYYTENYEYVSRERFKFTGNNKYLKNITYFAIDNDNAILMWNNDKYWITAGNKTIYTGPNSLQLTAIFENPRSIQLDSTKHWMDNEFPLEESLITTLIEMTVNALAKAVTAPTDTINNGTDENASMPSVMNAGKQQ